MDFEFFDLDLHPLLGLAIAAALAIIAGLLVHAVGLAVLRRLTRRFGIVNTVVDFAARPARFVLPLLFVQTGWYSAPPDAAFVGGLRHFTALALIAVVTWLAVRCIAGVVAAILDLSPVDASDNLHARRIQTQTRVIGRMLMFVAMLVGLSVMLMTFPEVRAVGTSLLASAGLAGIVAGVAARPVLSNLIAGLQIAFTQPIRLDDVLIVEGEWGRVEEITSAYVVVKLWDERRLVVPLQWFIEHPFQNWTRASSQIIGSVFLWVDYRMALQPLRAEMERVCKAAPEWDGRVAQLQVTDADQRAMQVRVIVSSPDSGSSWNLRCKVREALIDLMQREHREYLPLVRTELRRDNAALDPGAAGCAAPETGTAPAAKPAAS